tara:strand:- start:71 stop:331 length:261 start_codon:yes stop_codon:yes gene_type:complete
MSRTKRHIESQITINYEEPYAFKKPTTATFISKEIMETNAKKEDIRQTSKTVHAQSGLAQSEEAKGQTQKACVIKIMEGQTVGFST